MGCQGSGRCNILSCNWYANTIQHLTLLLFRAGKSLVSKHNTCKNILLPLSYLWIFIGGLTKFPCSWFVCSKYHALSPCLFPFTIRSLSCPQKVMVGFFWPIKNRFYSQLGQWEARNTNVLGTSSSLTKSFFSSQDNSFNKHTNMASTYPPIHNISASRKLFLAEDKPHKLLKLGRQKKTIATEKSFGPSKLYLTLLALWTATLTSSEIYHWVTRVL